LGGSGVCGYGADVVVVVDPESTVLPCVAKLLHIERIRTRTTTSPTVAGHTCLRPRREPVRRAGPGVSGRPVRALTSRARRWCDFFATVPVQPLNFEANDRRIAGRKHCSVIM
jgi:hypothetical protein